MKHYRSVLFHFKDLVIIYNFMSIIHACAKTRGVMMETIGIIIGILVGLCALIGYVYKFWRWLRRKKTMLKAKQSETE